MHILLTTLNGSRILVRVADIAVVSREGGRTVVVPLPGLPAPLDETVLVRDPEACFRDLPGMLATRIVEPHTEPRDAVVNVGAASLVEPCDEGVLLHFGGGIGRRRLVEADLDAVVAAIGDVANRD